MIKHLSKCLVLLSLCFSCGNNKPKHEVAEIIELKTQVDSSQFFFGHNLDSFEVVRNKIKYGETLGKILNNHGINHTTIHYLAKAAENVLDVKDFKVGKE